jgi:multidrug resistance efflux pump
MSDTEIYRLSSSQKRKIWFARRLRHWPFLLWILLAVLVTFGIRSTSKIDQVFGVVDYPTISVAATETGRIESILVAVGQAVAEDEELITLSSLEIDYEIAALQADEDELNQATRRQFFNSEQSINADLRELTLQQAQNEAELSILKTENQRLESLLSRGLIDADVVASNRMRIVSLETAMNSYPEYLQALQTEKAELEKLENKSPQSKEDNRAIQLSILKERAKSLIICANNSGVISNVLGKPGDVVRAGETLMELLGNDTPVIQGFIPLSAHRSIQPGDTVYLADKYDKRTIHQGTIASISPSVVGIEDTSTPLVARTVRGRMFIVESPAAAQWVESEQVSIFLEKPSNSTLQKWIYSMTSWMTITRNN